jgi:uncharacterized membrane protein
MFLLTDINCGGMDVVMDSTIPRLVTLAINLIKVVVPVLLIVFGMLDLGKAVMAQKEDEIKKGQQTFIKRLIAAVIVFLVVFIVQLAIGLVAPKDENASMWNCVDCLINYSSSNGNCPTA